MARDFAKRFYKSPVWRNARAEYIAYRKAIDGGLCETCKRELGYIVHHTIWITRDNINDPSVTLNKKYFRYDCLSCHGKEKDPTTIKGRCRYGTDGEILPPLDEA